MEIYRKIPFQAEPRPRALALGFFDGLHLGHQALINQLLEAANCFELWPAVFTFADYPLPKFSQVEDFAGLLMQEEQRLSRLADAGVEEIFIADFLPSIAGMSAADFFQQVIVDQIQARCLIVGQDFRFGYRAEGTLKQLAEWSRAKGIRLLVVDDVELLGEKVSSTRIRQLISTGRVEEANACLGRPYSVFGRVVRGRQLGRRLGFPTVNLKLDDGAVKPAYGVYASKLIYQGSSFEAISNIGTRPTVSSEPAHVQVETYIYDGHMDLYDQELEVELLAFIRPEKKFADLTALKKQVDADKQVVRQYHRDRSYDLNH